MTELGSKGDGLARVSELYQNRHRRAKELRSQGKKIIGYFCSLTPVEFLTALGLVPYRITGSALEPITRADAYIETIMCPYLRSCFDKGLKGDYDFLDGFVAPHACDHVVKIYDIWRYYLKTRYTHFVNVPHMSDASSRQFFREELAVFQRSLEKLVGNSLSPHLLTEAIRLHNENRALARELYRLRKPDPPLLSGTEVTKTTVAAVTIPVEESNELLRGVIQEVKARHQGPQKNARLLLYGAEIDDIAFIQMVEEAGSNIVMDDVCFGSRNYWHDVEITNDPLDGLITYYLEGLSCPRCYKPRLGTHQEDLENRLGYLRDHAREFDVAGAIVYVIRFCDTFEFDAPDVKDFLQGAGVPVLHIEEDYAMTSPARLKTRVQAFLEMIG